MIANPYQQYERVQAETASGGEIIILLYEGMVRFLNRAESRRQGGDWDGFVSDLRRVQDILTELAASLDPAIGGEVAGNLFNLYLYLNRRLGEAHYKKDEAAVPEVLLHLRDLKATWEDAVQVSASQQAATRPVAPVSRVVLAG